MLVSLLLLVMPLFALSKSQIHGKPEPPPLRNTPSLPALLPDYQTEFLRRHLGYINLADCVDIGAREGFEPRGTNQTCAACHWSSPRIDFRASWTGPTSGFVGIDKQLNHIVIGAYGAVTTQMMADVLVLVEDEDMDCDDCGVNDSYLTEFERVHPLVDDAVFDLMREYPSADLVLAGHQLGAAVMPLFAFKYEQYAQDITLFLTGEPAVGDRRFAATFNMAFHPRGDVWYRPLLPAAAQPRSRTSGSRRRRQVFRLTSKGDPAGVWVPKTYSHHGGEILVHSEMFNGEVVMRCYNCDLINCRAIPNDDLAMAGYSPETLYLERLTCQPSKLQEYVPVSAPSVGDPSTLPFVDPHEYRPLYWEREKH